MEILNSLGVRPTQLAIQMVGFIILFLGLRKFLWAPLLALFAQREKEIGDTYAAAEKAKQDAEDMKAEYKAHISKIEEEAAASLAEAVKKGNKLAEEIIAHARKEAEREKEKAANEIAEEAARARATLRDYTVGLSFDIAQRILEKEISKLSHEDLVKNFIKELDALGARNN